MTFGGPWGWRHYNFTESVHAGFDQKPSPTTNFSANLDGGLLAYRTNDGKLAVIYEISPWTYSFSWVPENVKGMVRVNYAGNVIFYTDNSNNLRAYFWGRTGWESTAINAAGSPVRFSGPFDIAPGMDMTNAQVYFQESDGFVHVAFVWDGAWITGHILCAPEPADRQCKGANFPFFNSFSALIRYNNGTVFYQGIMTTDNSWYFDNFRAYYYGKGDVDDI